MQTQDLEKKQILYYSLIAMPLAIVGLPLYIYLPTFYATEVGIDIAIVGLVLFLARLTDVFSDPYIGYLSDKSLKRFNSRKPIMVLGSFVLVFSFYFLINPSSNYSTLWLVFFSILIYFGWSMVNIPYLTWSCEISDKYHHKTQLNSFREVFAILGLVIALVVPYFFVSETLEGKLSTLYIFFVFLFIPVFFISMLKIEVKKTSVSSKFSFEDLKIAYKYIPYLKDLQIGYFLNNLANAIPATLFLLFIEVVIEQKEFSEEILILYFISGVLALPVWNYISKSQGKKKVWIYSIILASSSFLFVVFLGANDIVFFSIISFISGLSLGADIAFPTSLHGDVVQKIKHMQNNISGLLFGIWTMLTKLALALSVVITFGVLGLVGFDKENLHETDTLVLILLYGLLPVFLKLFALFFISKYKDEVN